MNTLSDKFNNLTGFNVPAELAQADLLAMREYLARFSPFSVVQLEIANEVDLAIYQSCKPSDESIGAVVSVPQKVKLPDDVNLLVRLLVQLYEAGDCECEGYRQMNPENVGCCCRCKTFDNIGIVKESAFKKLDVILANKTSNERK